jgi:hypothetical protein
MARKPPLRTGARDDVQERRAPEHRRTLLLGHAPGHGNPDSSSGSRRLQPQFAEPAEQFVLGPLPHAARVEHDEFRLVDLGGGLEAGRFEQAGHPLRVVHVHLATHRLDEVLLGHDAHRFAFALA